MLKPQPEQKIFGIIDSLADMSKSWRSNNFQLLKYKQEIGKLLSNEQNDPALCHMGLGLVYYHLSNREESERHLKNAVQLSPGEPIILQNYAVICSSFGNLREANSAVYELASKFPGVKSVIRCAIIQSFNALQINKCISYIDAYRKLVVNEVENLPDALIESVELLEQLISDNNVSADHLLDLLETAVQSVRNSGREILFTNSMQLRNGTTMYYLYLDADMDTCTQADWLIADALVDRFDDTGMEYLSIMCRPLKHLDRSLAIMTQ